MIPGVVASQIDQGVKELAHVQRANSALVSNATSGASATLLNNPKSGNTLLLFAKVSGIQHNQFFTPSGWTYLDGGSPSNGPAWNLFAKVSDGTEKNSPVISYIVTGTRLVTEYQEWQGTAPIATLIDQTNKIQANAGIGNSWDPVQVQGDQDNIAYLAFVALQDSPGSITLNWEEYDDYYNHDQYLYSYKVKTDGSPFNTRITWSSYRPYAATILPLRGAT